MELKTKQSVWAHREKAALKQDIHTFKKVFIISSVVIPRKLLHTCASAPSNKCRTHSNKLDSASTSLRVYCARSLKEVLLETSEVYRNALQSAFHACTKIGAGDSLCTYGVPQILTLVLKTFWDLRNRFLALFHVRMTFGGWKTAFESQCWTGRANVIQNKY